MKWAELYDTGGPDMRSKAMHQEWMSRLDCPIIRLEGVFSLNINLNKIIPRHTRIQTNNKRKKQNPPNPLSPTGSG